MSGWRWIEDGAPRPGAENMAIDQALLESVQAGGAATLRFYRWEPSCLSLGRNEPARGRYDAVAAASRGVDVVRRLTGGLAVHHDRELTYSVAVPVGALGSPRETYRAINRALVAGLRRLGVAARTQASTSRRPGRFAAGPCFGSAAQGEVVAHGRKLIGSAQCRERRTLLQHGSLLLEGDQGLVRKLMRCREREPEPTEPQRPAVDRIDTPAPVAPSPATLAALLGTVPAWPALTSALRAGFEEMLGTRLAQTTISRAERARAGELSARYRSAAWTWRR